MENTPLIILKTGKEQPVLRNHPWIFSGAIHKIIGQATDGQVVKVLDSNKNCLATGHYHQGSIAVKIFAFEDIEPSIDFWFSKFQKAFELRQLLDLEHTNCYRLIHGEGDGCPGLIIDVYAGVAVVQAHSIGMHLEITKIAESLKMIFGDKLLAVYDKSKETLPSQYAKELTNNYIYKTQDLQLPYPVLENGHTVLINWETGQKTGFFLDQRDNRMLLGKYAKNKSVLNAFCYSGGFSIYALRSGAKMVHSVDASQKAIDLVEANVAQNFSENVNHQSFTDDVMKFLKANDGLYDLMILDPPAYAKSIDARHRAVQGYKRLNAEGLSRLGKGGILFTFSCSQVVDKALFYSTIMAAAIEAKRNVRVLHHLSQPADHPVSLFHPEGSYLKGLVLYVE